MPFVAAPNIIQLEIRMTMDNQAIENRFMVDNLAEPDAAALQAAAIAAWDWWEGQLGPFLSSQVALREVLATDMGAIDGAQYTYAPDTTTTGGVSGAVLPNETALCVSLRTGNRGRSARGRMYVPGIPDAARDGPNTVSTTFAGNIIAAFDALLVAFPSTQPLVIVSYISEGVPRPGGPVYYVVTTPVLTDRILDSMRSRKPGVGT
jgi:hypothetical protein